MLTGIFGGLSVTVWKYLLYFFELPFVLPLFLFTKGVIIFFMIYSDGIFISTEGKTEYEVDKEIIEIAKERGYDVLKKY